MRAKDELGQERAGSAADKRVRLLSQRVPSINRPAIVTEPNKTTWMAVEVTMPAELLNPKAVRGSRDI